MTAVMARHDALIEQLVGRHSGSVVRPRREGDSRFAVFTPEHRTPRQPSALFNKRS
jgi:hypothetical protein